jgi:hypothetical protein
MRFNTNSKSVVTIGRFLLGRLFPLPFLIAGANVMFFGLRSMDRAKASTEWPSVRGVVVLSEVDSRGGHRGTSYFAEVLYDYEVDGAKHCSNRIGYGDYGYSNPNEARKTVNRYPKGKEVDVFYMPEKPEESVLEVGIHIRTYFLPTFGAVFFLAGLGMIVFLPKLRAKQAEQDVTPNA